MRFHFMHLKQKLIPKGFYGKLLEEFFYGKLLEEFWDSKRLTPYERAGLERVVYHEKNWSGQSLSEKASDPFPVSNLQSGLWKGGWA